MALTAAEWARERAQIEQAVTDKGQWVGLLDGEGEPVAELPGRDLDLGSAVQSIEEGTATFPVGTPDGSVHPLVARMFGDAIGGDGSALLDPGDNQGYMLCVQNAGGIEGRYVYTVEFPTLEGDKVGPLTLRMDVLELLGVLNFRPCPSVLSTWGEYPMKLWDTDAGKPYRVKRPLAPMQMATIAWGHTSKGPAVTTIARVVQDSLDAYDTAFSYDPSFVVQVPEGVDTSPEVLIRRQDNTVWDTVGEVARLAGVAISARMWWPGDPAVNTLSGKRTWNRAMGVIRVQQIGE